MEFVLCKRLNIKTSRVNKCSGTNPMPKAAAVCNQYKLCIDYSDTKLIGKKYKIKNLLLTLYWPPWKIVVYI